MAAGGGTKQTNHIIQNEGSDEKKKARAARITEAEDQSVTGIATVGGGWVSLATPKVAERWQNLPYYRCVGRSVLSSV